MHHPQIRIRSTLAVAAVAALSLAGCSTSGSTSDGAEATTTESTTTSQAETTTTTEAGPDDDDLAGGITMVGDKAVLLDGFIGVEIPDGWTITSTEVPTFSVSPPGGETELDPDALAQSLIINPVDDEMAASLALIHYEHSDSVPDLARFSQGISEFLAGDGSRIGEGSEATIGGQDAVLYQVESASGANGVLVTFESGGEYFFIISIVSDPSFSEDAGAMLASVSFVPEALHS